MAGSVQLYGGSINKAITANTDILSAGEQANCTPIDPPALVRIYICLDTAGVFTVRRKLGATTVSEQMNDGVPLNANAGYMFDIQVESGEVLNFRSSTTGNALKLLVVELQGDE